MQCPQLARRIDRQMHFRTREALRAVVAGARTGFRGRLQCAAVHDHGNGLRFASITRTQQLSPIMHDGPETARSHPAQRIEGLAKRVAALFAVFSHQRQKRHNERPFFVACIARVRLAGVHPDVLSCQRKSPCSPHLLNTGSRSRPPKCAKVDIFVSEMMMTFLLHVNPVCYFEFLYNKFTGARDPNEKVNVSFRKVNGFVESISPVLYWIKYSSGSIEVDMNF